MVVCAGIAETNMSSCSLLETSNAVCSRLPSSCNDDRTIFGLLMPPSLRKTKTAAPWYSRVKEIWDLRGKLPFSIHSEFLLPFFFTLFICCERLTALRDTSHEMRLASYSYSAEESVTLPNYVTCSLKFSHHAL